ncbi:hypothetical protein [Azonexus sp.]|uniref:hypothetical protein n=1 Tax=Azonexus sp. TaxID=1872668 RepID=UPI0035B31215
MARYKWIDTSPRFLAVDLAKQLLPGSFEHAVHHLFEHEIDLGGFELRPTKRTPEKLRSVYRAPWEVPSNAGLAGGVGSRCLRPAGPSLARRPPARVAQGTPRSGAPT